MKTVADMLNAPDPAQRIYSVSRLNREARLLLEEGLGVVWVEGELSSLARPSSGHIYFSLKDAQAQVRCAMFRQFNRRLDFGPENGQQVLVRARAGVYEARGDYQLVVEHMEEAGLGRLRREFEALKQRLAAEGLFDQAAKRTPPRLPRRIGVITSPTGAALHDILTTLARRFPAVPVLVYPTAVQGREAAGEIAAALELAGRRGDCDVLLLARGGGSLEDLWPFNEEVVARAIRACPVPVIAGVGHEVDVTIADFAADLRAPTPTGAAELVVPDRQEWLRSAESLALRLGQGARRDLAARRRAVDTLGHRLQRCHPGVRLRQDAQGLDLLERRLHQTLARQLSDHRLTLQQLTARVQRQSPQLRLARLSHSLQQFSRRLAQTLPPALATRSSRLERARDALLPALRTRLRERAKELAALERALRSCGPEATLARGYAIVTGPDGSLLRDASRVHAGDTIHTRLERGAFESRVLPDGEAPGD